MNVFQSVSSEERVETQEEESSDDIKDKIFEDDEDLYSLEQTCRTCSRNIDDKQMLLPIFETNLSFNISPIEVIEEINFISLKIKSNDGLPQQICNDCMSQLMNISSFRKQCEKNQLTLSVYFHNKCSISSTNKIGRNSIVNNIENFQLNEIDETYKVEVEKYEIESEDANDVETENQFDVDHHGNIDKDSHQNNKEFIKIAPNKNLIAQKNPEMKSNKISVRQKYKSIRKKLVQCSFCKDTFKTKTALESHRRKSHRKIRSNNICPICKQVFTTVSNRNSHLVQTHNEEKPFKCDICDKGFKSEIFLKRHKATHIKGDFECSICFRHLDTKALYNYHMRTHNANKKYKCQYCDKPFLQRHDLSKHERTHTGLRPFLCKVCGKGFKQERSLQLHLLMHSDVRPHVCNTCGKGFSHRSSLNMHSRLHGKKQYICNICEKDFSQRGTLVAHMRLHTGIKPYQCEICGKTFNKNHGLTVHLRTHTGEKPFKCDQCDCAFVQRYHLMYHKYSTHSGPHPLGRKDDVFRSRKTHIKTHSEEKKFTCEECGNKFKRIDYLKSHVNRIHLKLRPFPCQYCDKAFAKSSDRKVHMRRHNTHSSKLSIDENKSLNTRSLNEVQSVLTSTQ